MQKLTYPYRPMLESLRALRWHRIAPPFPANRGEILFSEAWLTDEWHYPVRDAGLWPNVSDVTKQFSAPAIIARNMPLPEVQATGETPFVVCSTHPDTHALSVAVVPRTLPDQLYVTPAATIRVCCADPDAPMGLFGHWQSVELVFDRPAKGQRVWGQDLASEEAVELTGQVQLTGTGLIVPAAVLKALTQNGDHEDALPGIVLRVME